MKGNFTDIQRWIRRHLREIVFVALLLFVFFLIVSLARHFIVSKHYSGYRVLSEEERYDNVSKYEYIEGSILRYSLDGAALMRSDWDVLWNVTFNMTQPTVANCDETVLIYDKGNTELRVYNRGGQIGQFSSEGPIIRACVSAAGNVACAINKGDEIAIIYYSLEGKEIAVIMTAFDETGAPLAFAVSPDGLRLAVSYVTQAAGEIGSRLVFYDFGAAGKDKVGNAVASENYVGTLIPELQFVDNEHLLAYRDNGITLYRSGAEPTKTKVIDFDREIVSLFHDNRHIGVLFRDTDGEARYSMEVYGVTLRRLGRAKVDMIFDRIRLCDDRILFLGGNALAVYDLKGHCLFDGALDEGNVSDIIRVSSNRYFVFTDMKAETMKLV